MLLPLDKDKKSESKSQHWNVSGLLFPRCCRWTKIKNLKANHNTYLTVIILFLCCCRWTKIKNLKANHNVRLQFSYKPLVVAVGQR